MNDAYEGLGGSYALDPETGVRTLIARTREPGAAPPDPAPQSPPAAAPAQPAQAGFLTPADPVPPADSTHTTE
ncbi:hypothetical protein AAKU55_003143 [Oxalobacteraceae bacterium GrIS 1.11]